MPSGPTAPGRPTPTLDTVIVGGNEETRLLLRGLLRLHRYRVLGETRSAQDLDPSEDPRLRRVLVLVADSDGTEWSAELAIARERQAGLLPLLVVEEVGPELVDQARAAGVLGLLARPFAIRDLISTVESVGRGEERLR